MDVPDVGERVYQLRLLRGLEQEELANKAGISQSYVSKIETGNTNPSLKTLDKIAKVLNVERKEFFEQDTSQISLDDPKLYDHFSDEVKQALCKESNVPYIEFAVDLINSDITDEELEAMRKLFRTRK